MKRLLVCALVLAALPASAQEKREATFTTSSSSSSRSFTDGDGNTVTTTTTERDGKRETRRTVVAPDGKVLSDTSSDAPESVQPGGAWLGVHATELPAAMREQLDLPADEGLLIEQLPPDSPAANAGIAQHDILLTFNLAPIATPAQLREALAKCRPGEKATIEYLHKARREKANVSLGQRGISAEPKAAKPNAGLPPIIPGKAVTRSSSRTVIVGADGAAKVFESDDAGDPFAKMLRDPNVPETMKESLRKMQQQMRDFQKRTTNPKVGQ